MGAPLHPEDAPKAKQLIQDHIEDAALYTAANID